MNQAWNGDHEDHDFFGLVDPSQKVNLELLEDRSGVQIFAAFSFSFSNTALKSPSFLRGPQVGGSNPLPLPSVDPELLNTQSFPWEFFQARKLAKLPYHAAAAAGE